MDDRAKYLILSSLMPNECGKLSSYSTSHELWKELERIHERTNNFKMSFLMS